MYSRPEWLLWWPPAVQKIEKCTYLLIFRPERRCEVEFFKIWKITSFCWKWRIFVNNVSEIMYFGWKCGMLQSHDMRNVAITCERIALHVNEASLYELSILNWIKHIDFGSLDRYILSKIDNMYRASINTWKIYNMYRPRDPKSRFFIQYIKCTKDW